MPELLPCPCTIDAGCFILIDRNRFQPGRPKECLYTRNFSTDRCRSKPRTLYLSPIKSIGCTPRQVNQPLHNPCRANKVCHNSTMLATGIAIGSKKVVLKMRAARVCRSGRLWSTSASTRLPEEESAGKSPKARRIVYGQLEGTVLYDRAVIAQSRPRQFHRVKQTAPYRLSKGQQNKQNNASQAGQQEQPGRTSFPLGGRTAVAPRLLLLCIVQVRSLQDVGHRRFKSCAPVYS